jgi:hypothetical protein
MYLKIEGGQQFVSDSPKGPWVPRLWKEAVLEAKNRQQEKRRKEKIMGQSGFDRAIEEEERRRRRLREADHDIPFDLSDDELDELLAEVRRYAKDGRGEGGQRLTRREVTDFFARQLDDAHEEPSEKDEALEQITGRRARGRHRLRQGEMSNADFLRTLFG